jgi:ABC-type lipoprotein release transport system permease subunit
MAAVWMLARAELRHRWRSTVVLTLLVGFVGAVVLALLAGARRTDTSLERFEQQSRAATVEIDIGEATPSQVERFRRVPGVAAAAQLRQLTMVSGSQRFIAVAGQVDDRFGKEVDRARVIEGRLADQSRPDEVTIGESLASELHLRVGDRLHFQSYSPADVEASRVSNTAPAEPRGPNVALRVVGIVRRPLDLGGRGTAGGVVVLTKAFTDKYRDQIGSFAGSILRVRTEGGAADVRRVTSAAKRMFGSADVFSFQSLGIEGQGAQNAIDVTTVGLYIAAGVAALTGIVGVGIALSREIALVDGDQLTLSALGVRPRSRIAAAAAVGIPVAVVGALLAVVGAILASPLFPIGVAADAEPDPGIHVDAFAVLVGAAVVLLAVLVISAIAAARTARIARVEHQATRPGFATRAVSEVGAPPPVAAGMRFALDQGRTRPALPVRSSLVGATFGILVVVAVLVFSASLDHLVSTPSAYGWTWDTTAGDLLAKQTGNDCGPITTRFADEPVVSAVASVCSSGVQIDGRPVPGWGFGQLRGRIEPRVAQGRPPATSSEVALGGDTLSAAGRSVGDRVRITGPDRTRTYRIVGRAVMPGISDPTPLADSAVFTAAGLARLGDANGGWNLVVRFAPGVERARAVRRLRALGGPEGEPLAPTVPVEIDRVQRIDGLPIALAVFVAVVALVAVGFALVTAVRRRRRDLAVLKTLGFDRRQIRSTVAWHATTVAAIGLLLGIPLGLVVGRVVWRLLADELGVAGTATWPVLAIVVLVPVALLFVNLIAAFPARRAARTRPAVVLRSE